MNKSVKILLLGLGAVILVGGIVVDSVIQKEILIAEKQINYFINNAKTKLPEHAIQEHRLQKGLLSSRGEYRLIVPDKKNSSIVVVRYNLYHGLSYIIDQKIHFDARTSFQLKGWQILNTQTNNSIASQGSINQDGTISIINNKFELVEEVNSELNNINRWSIEKSFIDIDKLKENIVFNADISKREDFLNNRLISMMQDVKLKYDFSLNGEKETKIKAEIKYYESKSYALKNTTIISSLENLGDKKNAKINIEADAFYSIYFPKSSKLSIDLVTRGFNDEFINQKISISKKDEQLILLKQLRDGFFIELNKFELTSKNDTDKVLFKAYLHNKSVNKLSEIQPSKQVDSTISIKTNGAYTEDFLNLYQDLSIVPKGDYSSFKDKELNMLFQYKDNDFFINNNLANDKSVAILLKGYLRALDKVILSK